MREPLAAVLQFRYRCQLGRARVSGSEHAAPDPWEVHDRTTLRKPNIDGPRYNATDPVGRSRARRRVVRTEGKDGEVLSDTADDWRPLRCFVRPEQGNG